MESEAALRLSGNERGRAGRQAQSVLFLRLCALLCVLKISSHTHTHTHTHTHKIKRAHKTRNRALGSKGLGFNMGSTIYQ